jgi:glycosyltransferase involved in cell wall biosynthesis
MSPPPNTTLDPLQELSDASAIDVSVVIPCLNESETIATCIVKARRSLDDAGLSSEVIVSDNGSEDGSVEIAETAGARVVHASERGYGNAYLAGFAAAKGRYIVMGDGDDTYPFELTAEFVEPLRDGADMVMGSRLKGKIHKGAMPALHRYVGNPVLTGVLNVMYGSGVSDAHCGMRAFRREKLEQLDLRMPGMEFASEMVIRASKEGLAVREIPIEYRPRKGESKLNSFRDGWRHLRFLLVHSPTHLFLLPGMIMLALGMLGMAAVLFDLNAFGRQWDLHAMIAASIFAIAGSQLIGLGLVGRAYSVHHLGDHDQLFDRYEGRIHLEHGLVLGLIVFLGGLGIAVGVGVTWIGRGFGALGDEQLAVLSLTLLAVGMQIVFTSFLMSIVGLRRNER